MESMIKKRVKKLMNDLSISAYAIAKSCSMNERTIYEQTNGSSKISISMVEALLSFNPNISAEWLMRGTGSMLLDDSNIKIDPEERCANKRESELEYIIELQRHRIAQLERDCEDLKKANSTATTSHATTA